MFLLFLLNVHVSLSLSLSLSHSLSLSLFLSLTLSLSAWICFRIWQTKKIDWDIMIMKVKIIIKSIKINFSCKTGIWGVWGNTDVQKAMSVSLVKMLSKLDNHSVFHSAKLIRENLLHAFFIITATYYCVIDRWHDVS